MIYICSRHTNPFCLYISLEGLGLSSLVLTGLNNAPANVVLKMKFSRVCGYANENLFQQELNVI